MIKAAFHVCISGNEFRVRSGGELGQFSGPGGARPPLHCGDKWYPWSL